MYDPRASVWDDFLADYVPPQPTGADCGGLSDRPVKQKESDMPYPSDRVFDYIGTTLDKCLRYHELVEPLREQLATCGDPDKRKEIQAAIEAHTAKNDAMCKAATQRLRNYMRRNHMR